MWGVFLIGMTIKRVIKHSQKEAKVAFRTKTLLVLALKGELPFIDVT